MWNLPEKLRSLALGVELGALHAERPGAYRRAVAKSNCEAGIEWDLIDYDLAANIAGWIISSAGLAD